MFVDLSEGLENAELQQLEPKLIGAAGLARRAGKLVIGAELCEETVRAGKAEITFLASDMSDNARKKLTAALRASDSPYITLNATKEQLADKFGKKSFAVALSITDKGFAKIIYKALGISE